MKATASAKTAFLASILAQGEIYAGIILGKDGQPDHHLILLPGHAVDVTFPQAQEFADKAGGDLPTRREQAVLYANLKEEFEDRWYWSGEQHAAYSGCAWCQDFGSGNQRNSLESAELRACAVRRVVI